MTAASAGITAWHSESSLQLRDGIGHFVPICWIIDCTNLVPYRVYYLLSNSADNKYLSLMQSYASFFQITPIQGKP